MTSQLKKINITDYTKNIDKSNDKRLQGEVFFF